MTAPLYRRVLGHRFDALAPSVRSLHDLQGSAQWHGRANVERGTSIMARLGAGLIGLPKAGADQPLSVTFVAIRDQETWRRTFGASVFLTTQSAGAGTIIEQAGLVRLTLVPEVRDAELFLRLASMSFCGLPLPRFLRPIVTTREYEEGGRYCFEVESRLPPFGLLVRYSGWLEPR